MPVALKEGLEFEGQVNIYPEDEVTTSWEENFCLIYVMVQKYNHGFHNIQMWGMVASQF